MSVKGQGSGAWNETTMSESLAARSPVRQYAQRGVVALAVLTLVTWRLQPVLASVLLRVDGPIAKAVVVRPGLLTAAQAATLVVEFAAALAFSAGWARDIVLASLAAFHNVSYLLRETEFAGFIVCYAVFFRLEEILVRARSLLSPRLSEAVDVG